MVNVRPRTMLALLLGEDGREVQGADLALRLEAKLLEGMPPVMNRDGGAENVTFPTSTRRRISSRDPGSTPDVVRRLELALAVVVHVEVHALANDPARAYRELRFEPRRIEATPAPDPSWLASPGVQRRFGVVVEAHLEPRVHLEIEVGVLPQHRQRARAGLAGGGDERRRGRRGGRRLRTGAGVRAEERGAPAPGRTARDAGQHAVGPRRATAAAPVREPLSRPRR